MADPGYTSYDRSRGSAQHLYPRSDHPVAALPGVSECYHCAETGHFVRDCPKKLSGCPPSKDAKKGRRSREHSRGRSRDQVGNRGRYHSARRRSRGRSGSRDQKSTGPRTHVHKWPDQNCRSLQRRTFAIKNVYQDDNGTFYAAAADLEELPGTEPPDCVGQVRAPPKAAPAPTSAAGLEPTPRAGNFLA